MHETLSERWNRVSLRSKITGVTVLMLTVGLLVSGIGTMAMLRQYMTQQVDQRLASVAYGKTDKFGIEGNSEFASVTSESESSEYFVAAFDREGNPLVHNWQTRPIEDLPIITNTLPIETTYDLGTSILELRDSRGTAFHAMVVPLQFDKGTFGTALIAVSMRQTDNIMATYLSIFLGFGIGVVILGALITRMLVTSTFSPLREVERTAAAIADGDFSQRLGGATPNTEVGRLNRSLNTMLNRIDRAFKDRARSIEQMRRFVGDASHELRTPLVSVRGYAELYRMGALQTPEDVAQAMDRIEKEAIRMGGLVEDLLSLARLDETKPLELAPVDLVPIARDAALDTMASSPDRTVTVILPPSVQHDLEPSDAVIEEPAETTSTPERLGTSNATGPVAFAGATLARLRGRRYRKADAASVASGTILASAIAPSLEPAEAVQAVVLAEENKIRQVLTNLLGNAMRFSPSGSPIEIGVAIDESTDRAVLSVIDHGDGIPPQIREKIFQRFWRADTSRTRETGGSGLGLAIVSAIIAAHNGTVDVVETPGGGATFRVSLPLATSPSAPQPLDATGTPTAAVPVV
ncbi:MULTISPECIES: sensor histidine kinase [unclassified Leifsonia]|uniref:sensor histidine kinase n=1 Tax=unclassified Leifsonia TaxID=2663824 RepID=UPI00070134A0|nr:MULTISPECIES: HAMP domain-containing sensor histidine kinase [unclassified Leifsonia]KQX07789.1 histidine kinase [Leifsonia sp. Root1293]KRA12071.1 histidine kinase [Leifsonia sp. Root60]